MEAMDGRVMRGLFDDQFVVFANVLKGLSFEGIEWLCGAIVVSSQNEILKHPNVGQAEMGICLIVGQCKQIELILVPLLLNVTQRLVEPHGHCDSGQVLSVVILENLEEIHFLLVGSDTGKTGSDRGLVGEDGEFKERWIVFNQLGDPQVLYYFRRYLVWDLLFLREKLPLDFIPLFRLANKGIEGVLRLGLRGTQILTVLELIHVEFQLGLKARELLALE